MDLEVYFPKALNITACTFGGKWATALAVCLFLRPMLRAEQRPALRDLGALWSVWRRCQ